MYSNFVRINSQYSDKRKDNSEKYLTNSRGGYNGKQGHVSGNLSTWVGSRVRIPHRNATVMSICYKSGLSLVRRAQTLELRVHGISQFGCTPLGTSFFYPRK